MKRPEPNEAATYYSHYINLVPEGDIVDTLEKQLEETSSFLSEISEEKSLERYAPDKWSLRELLKHINDTERIFVFRALWFARGFTSPLPGFDQEIAVKGAGADQLSWASQVEEFRSIRFSTVAFFRGLPKEAWDRSGIASDNPFTVRALAYIAAGHVQHHADVIRNRYLATAAD
ncbi:MAG TPA: DinB family protein [Pyrinomonadaceae bacterium]|nr:DinB family protein [Pyrinomonadaceae bacterium]